MLGAVKMEGHEHADWSGSGYYGETEVRALYTGVHQGQAPRL